MLAGVPATDILPRLRNLALAGAVILAATLAGCATAAPASPAATLGGTPATQMPTATVAAPSQATPTTAPTPDLGLPDLAGKFDVGGHSLYIECRGTTGPVMVLEAGSGSPAATWLRSPFITLLDHRYRRCIFDRANVGNSEKAEGPRTSATAATELHRLLEAAGLPGPYVLVGRSFGGYNVRLFASMYPDDVSALVLMETLTPEFHAGMKELLTPMQWASEASFNRTVEYPLDIIASGPLVAAAKLPEIPLLVIAATESHTGDGAWPAEWPGPALDALWMKSQEGLAASVPGGRLVVLQGDHSLYVAQPQRLADEINAFLAAQGENPAMAKIDVSCVTAADGWLCDVTVADEAGESRHSVTLTRAAFQRLTPSGGTPDALVRRSFEFLLAREPRESILKSFALTDVGKYFADYEAEIRKP
jgi:pimeloyl-ACP methyl ester carboxylesterase